MLLTDKELRSTAKVVAMFLADVASDWTTGIAKISSLKIATAVGLSDAAVRKELPVILARGYLGSTPGGKGAGNFATYWMIPIAEPEKTKPQETKLHVLGDKVLGNDAGTIIADLIKACGGNTEKAETVVELASEENNPRGYVDNAMKQIAEGTWIDY
ncbi:hypothetical protein [Bradyrhizobium sp. LB13.1]